MEGLGRWLGQRAGAMATDDLPFQTSKDPHICEHEYTAPVLRSNRCSLPDSRVDDRCIAEWSNENLQPLEHFAVEMSHCPSQPFWLLHQHTASTRKQELLIKDSIACVAVLRDPRVHPSALELRQLGHWIRVHSISSAAQRLNYAEPRSGFGLNELLGGTCGCQRRHRRKSHPARMPALSADEHKNCPAKIGEHDGAGHQRRRHGMAEC